MKVSQQSVGYWISTATRRSHRADEIDILYPAERTDLLPVVPSWNIFTFLRLDSRNGGTRQKSHSVRGDRVNYVSNELPWKSMNCRSNSIGGWAPYVSRAGMFKSSMKKICCRSNGGPYTSLRLFVNFSSIRSFFYGNNEMIFSLPFWISNERTPAISRFNESLKFFSFVLLYILYVFYVGPMYDLSHTWVWFALVLAEKVIKSQINFFGMFLESFAVTVRVFPLPVGPTHRGFELLINR